MKGYLYHSPATTLPGMIDTARAEYIARHARQVQAIAVNARQLADHQTPLDLGEVEVIGAAYIRPNHVLVIEDYQKG